MTLYLLSKFLSHSCVTLPELKANLVEFVQDLTCRVFSGSPLFILTLTCLTKDAENVSKMLKPRLEKVPAAPINGRGIMQKPRAQIINFENNLNINKSIVFVSLC